MLEEKRQRVNPGYRAGSATKEVAMTLSAKLWAAVQERASDELKEIIAIQNMLECIMWDIGIEDSLSDPLSIVIRALELLDKLKETDPKGAPSPAKV